MGSEETRVLDQPKPQKSSGQPVRLHRAIPVLAALALGLLVASSSSAQGALIAHYDFDVCDWDINGIATDSVGGHDGTVTGGVFRNGDPTSGRKPDTCGTAEFVGGAIDITGLPVSTASGAKTSVSFWMYWDGTNSVMPIGWQYHDLWFYGGSFGFNSAGGDIRGISSAGLAGGWHHVTAVFTNQNLPANKLYIDGVAQTLTQRRNSPNNARAVVDPHLRIGGWWGTNGYRFSGKLDEVKVYTGEVSQVQIDADVAAVTGSCTRCVPPPPQPATRIARYSFDEDWQASGTLEDSIGSADGRRTGTVDRVAAPAAGTKPDTCFAGDFGGGAFDIYGLPVSTADRAKTSVSFWMYWDGTNSVMPFGWQYHDLWLYGGSFGFNSAGGDIRGISSSGLAGGWHHVAAVFTNRNMLGNKLYIDGVEQTLTQRRNSPNNARAVVDPHLRIGGWWADNGYRFRGRLDELNVYTGELSAAEVLADMNASCRNEIAWYQMEQQAWDGTAGQVTDDTGNGHDATAVGGSDTDDTDPALTGNPGTCSYGDFDGVDDHVELPASFPDLTGSFTISAWIQLDRASSNGRVLADDQGNSRGYALSVGDGGVGELRFFSRGVSPVSVDTLGVGLAAGTWTHVAAVHDVAAKTRQIYVNGVAQRLTGGSTAPTYTSTWGNDPGPASIGGETRRSPERGAQFFFDGLIDEVRVFDSALSRAEIAAAYAERHACRIPSSLDHFRIDAGAGTSSTCAPTSVTLTACATSSCGTVLTGYTGTATLSTSTGHGNWSKASARGALSPDPDGDDDGSASYTFSASDGGVAVLHLSSAHADDLTVTASDASASVANTSGVLRFRDNAFVLGADPVQVAGRDQSMTATLWQRDGADCRVATEYSGPKPIRVWITRDAADPGGAAPTIAATPVPDAPSTAFTLPFVAGVARFALETSDVGKYVLNLRDDTRSFAVSTDIDSDAVTLIPRPFGFDLQAQDAGGAGNPAASGPGGGAFVGAGQPFRVSARAVLWQAADDADDDGIPDEHADADPGDNADLSDNGSTPSFGQEGTGETVVLTGALVLPAGGRDPGLSSSAITSFVGGSGSAADVRFGEVGIVEIKAALADGSYLGAADVIGASGFVGRFVPDHFLVDGVLLSNRTDAATQAACASSFTFLDEDLRAQFDITARSASGVDTENYTGGFVKLAPTPSLGDGTGTSSDSLNLVASHGGAAYTPADRLTGAVPTVSMANGATTSPVALTFQMDRTSGGGLQPEPPFAGIEFGVDPTDIDGVQSNGGLTVTMPSGAESFTPLGSTTLYFGRLVVENAHGSELSPLPIWAHTEYCAAVDATPACTRWADLSRSVPDDDCTMFPVAAPTDTAIEDHWQGGTAYGPGVDVRFRAFDLVVNRGGGGWRMRYTGGGTGTQVSVPDLGGDTVETYHDYLLLEPGVVTFGIYRGDDNVIFTREDY